MGRLEVRTAVAAFFAEADLQFVGKVFPARPEIVPEDAYETNRLGEAVPSVAGSSAVLVVNIPSDVRTRRADTGRGAVNDTYIHAVAMEVFFASTKGEAIPAQQDYDTVIDGMITLIRSNATMNTVSTIWSAGEYEHGVQHEQKAPMTGADGMTVLISGVVKFEAYEWIAGAA